MKCRLDGPRPEDVAYRVRVDGTTKIVGTSRCTWIQKTYERMYGNATRGSSTGLPRRVSKRKLQPESVAGQKRLRESQIQETKGVPVGVEDESRQEELKKLESITQDAAKKRFGKRQENYALTLQQYADAKRKLAAEDAGPANPASSSGEKLAAHLAENEKAAKVLRDLEKRSLSLVMDKPALPSGTVVVATSADAADQIRRLDGHLQLWPEGSGDCKVVAKSLLRSPKPTIWLCSNSDEEQQMFFPLTNYTTFTACCRLLGGWVATPYWLKLAVSEGRMLQPLVRLQRGMDVSMELHFDKSLMDESGTSPEATAVAIAYRAAEEEGIAIKWTVRKKSKQLTLCP